MPSETRAYVRINNAAVIARLNGLFSNPWKELGQLALARAKQYAPVGKYPGKNIKASPTGEPPIRDILEVRFINGAKGPSVLIGGRSRHLVYQVRGTDRHEITGRAAGPRRTIRTAAITPGEGGRRVIGEGRGIGSRGLFFWWERKGVFFDGPKVTHPGHPPNPFLQEAIEDAIHDFLIRHS